MMIRASAQLAQNARSPHFSPFRCERTRILCIGELRQVLRGKRKSSLTRVQEKKINHMPGSSVGELR